MTAYIVYEMFLGSLWWAKVVSIVNLLLLKLRDPMAGILFSSVCYQWVYFKCLKCTHIKRCHCIYISPIIFIFYQNTPKYITINCVKYLFDIVMGTFWLKTRRVLCSLVPFFMHIAVLKSTNMKTYACPSI
jgi:hypothetical protein